MPPCQLAVPQKERHLLPYLFWMTRRQISNWVRNSMYLALLYQSRTKSVLWYVVTTTLFWCLLKPTITNRCQFLIFFVKFILFFFPWNELYFLFFLVSGRKKSHRVWRQRKTCFFSDAIILNYKMSQNAELLQFLLKPNNKWF